MTLGVMRRCCNACCTSGKTEAELFSYRLVAICWPDEVEPIQALWPAARACALELVERGPMDDLVQAMGISGQLARSEILNQAEGRPGWAVALGDLLLRAGNPDRS